MQHITNEELKAACRKAYAEKTLTPFAPEFDNHQPKYRTRARDGKVYKCALGAAMSDETLNRVELDLLNGSRAPGLNKSVVEFEDLMFATQVQDAHDWWCFSIGNMRDAGTPAARKRYAKDLGEYRAKFLSLIGVEA